MKTIKIAVDIVINVFKASDGRVFFSIVFDMKSSPSSTINIIPIAAKIHFKYTQIRLFLIAFSFKARRTGAREAADTVAGMDLLRNLLFSLSSIVSILHVLMSQPEITCPNCSACLMIDLTVSRRLG